MKKLLFIAIALVAAGSIAFAISAFTGSSASGTPGPAEVRDDDSGRDGGRGLSNCIRNVWVHYQEPMALDKCRVTFRAKHWDESEWCCGHDVGTLSIKVGGGYYGDMALVARGLDDPPGCYFTVWERGGYTIDNETWVDFWVKDSADELNCNQFGELWIDCQ